MFRMAIIAFCLMSAITGRNAAAVNAQDQSGKIEQPGLEMLEFLGEWNRDQAWFDRAIQETAPDKTTVEDKEVNRDEGQN